MRFTLKWKMENGKNILIFFVLVFCLPLILAAPSISFISPTPNNNSITTNTSVEINVSILELSLGSLIYNWNSTNFTLYDGNLLWNVGLNNNINIGDSLSSITDVSRYSKNGTIYPISASVNDNFESGTGNWVYRDGNWLAPIKDCTTSSSGSCSINTTTTTVNAGSVWIENTGSSYAKNGLIIDFDYKCESGIKWGMMFFEGGVTWSCIQGSGTSGCGASFTARGAFSPSITCDNTWRHANYSLNWGAGTISQPIIGDWSGSNTANKRLWFDNFVIQRDAYSSGKYNLGMNFDGIDDYISSSQSFYDSETFSLWVKTTKTGPLMAWSQGALGGYYDRELAINSAATQNVSWYIWNKAIIYSDKNVNDGNWHHIAATGNATEMKIYIDGVVSASRIAASNSDAVSDNTITLGASVTGYFNGTIDEVRIWNRSLSANEIYQLYISNLYKFNSTQWYFYVNQSKNSTSDLNLGLYTYQVFATNSTGTLNSTEQRIVDISSSICPSSKRNWNINMGDNLLINSLCNITGYNLTFTGTGNFTINNTLYFDKINNLSSGMTIWIKPSGIIYQGAI